MTIKKDKGFCTIEGCNEPVRSNTFCAKHYYRNWKKGNPLAPDEDRSEVMRNVWKDKRHHDTIEEFLFSKINKTENDNDCWNAKRGTSGRYTEGEYKIEKFLLHRKSYELFNGPIPENLIVRHKCDNTLCCNPNHLELGTKKDNRKDFMERHPRAKEITDTLLSNARIGVRYFWDGLTAEEKDIFVKKRTETQRLKRLERLNNNDKIS